MKEERAIRDKEEQALKVQLENHKADLTNQYGKVTTQHPYRKLLVNKA